MLPQSETRSLDSTREFVVLFDRITDNTNAIANEVKNDGNHGFPPKIDLSPVTGKITGIRISKSLIHQLIYKGEPYPVCPYKFYHVLLLRDIVVPPTDSQIRGLYFETKCLGLSADGNATVDLPRHKKTGARLADHDRIDQAVERFFEVKREYGLIVDENNTQVYHRRRWIDFQHNFGVNVFLDGTLDVVSPIKTPAYDFAAATIDLKLTKDRDVCECFSNGLYHSTPWGNMESADFTEAMMYRIVFGKPFIYLVFDYKRENAGFKDIPVITDVTDPDPKKAAKARTRMRDLQTTIRFVVKSVLQWEDTGWPMVPIAKVCSSCPILDCTKRNETMEV